MISGSAALVAAISSSHYEAFVLFAHHPAALDNYEAFVLRVPGPVSRESGGKRKLLLRGPARVRCERRKRRWEVPTASLLLSGLWVLGARWCGVN